MFYNVKGFFENLYLHKPSVVDNPTDDFVKCQIALLFG
jgi:hypothetical protein